MSGRLSTLSSMSSQIALIFGGLRLQSDQRELVAPQTFFLMAVPVAARRKPSTPATRRIQSRFREIGFVPHKSGRPLATPPKSPQTASLRPFANLAIIEDCYNRSWMVFSRPLLRVAATSNLSHRVVNPCPVFRRRPVIN